MTNLADFLERLSTEGELGTSEYAKAWAYLLRDPSASAARLASTLVTYIEAPEKSDADKYMPKGMTLWAQHVPIEPQQRKDAAEEVLSTLLSTLSSWLPHPAKHSRVRVLQLILSVLRGLPREVELEQDEIETVLENIRTHLSDKDERVRELAVIALLKLVVIEEEGHASQDPIIEELLRSLACDLSQSVRAAVVMRLPLDASTYRTVMDHRADRSAKVAAEVYNRMARGVRLVEAPEQGGLVASLKDRVSWLWYGIQEPRPEVRKAAEHLLETWYSQDARGDVTLLLGALDVERNPGLCHLVLERLAALDKWDPQAWLRDAAANGRSMRALVTTAGQSGESQQGPSLADVSPELAFVWAHACRVVDERLADCGRVAATKVAAAAAQVEASAGAQAEAVLDEFLPTAHEMAELCQLAAGAGPEYRYVAFQLLEVACLPYMNWVDTTSRETAETTLWRIITCAPSSADAAPLSENGAAARGYLPPVGAGGSGDWEAAVMRLAARVYGSGSALVGAVLPMVLRLAEEIGLAGQRPEAVEEGHLVQVLTYLQVLMTEAGSKVPPSASTNPPPDGAGVPVSLEQTVDQLAWIAGMHISPAVLAAAIRCRVVLCLREGGLAQLPRAVAMLSTLLPACRGGAAAEGPSTSAAVSGGAERGTTARHQLPQRAAVQGMIDLALTWGEPAVTEALRDVASRHRLDAVTAQMAGLGMEVDDGAAAQAGAAAAGAADDAVTAHQAQGVVPVLLRLTEGVVRRFAGTDSYAAATGPAADALLGAARLLLAWPTQRKLEARLRHQAVKSTQSSQAEQLFMRLLLARFAKSVESQVALRSQLSSLFKAFKDAASAPGPDGAAYRELLTNTFLHAARCAIALPPLDGAPATVRCGAPALMEFAAELMASVAASAAASAEEPADDPDGDAAGSGEAAPQAAAGCAPCSECARLCELALEELTRLASPGGGSLDTSEKGVQAYAAELCKTPMRLAPGLAAAPEADPAAVLATVRRLAYLCRRAVDAAQQSLVGSVVTATAFKKLQEFMQFIEGMQREKTPMLTDEEALPAVKELLRKLESLPSLEDVHAEVEVDEDWDTYTDPSLLSGDQGSTMRRGGASRARGATSSKRGTSQRQKTSKATSSRTARSRRGGARDQDRERDDSDSSDDAPATDDDEDVAATTSGRSAGAARAASNTAAAPARPTASQGSMASVTASQGERRSSRAAAAKAAAKMQDMKARDAAVARLERLAMSQGSRG